ATAAASGTYNCGGFVPAASNAISGPGNADGFGAVCDGMPVWSDGVVSDSDPTLTVSLAQPETIDRVYVAGQGLGSVEAGLRSFDVQVEVGGAFTTVASVTNAFFQRDNLLTFAPQSNVTAIRITNITINY